MTHGRSPPSSLPDLPMGFRATSSSVNSASNNIHANNSDAMFATNPSVQVARQAPAQCPGDLVHAHRATNAVRDCRRSSVGSGSPAAGASQGTGGPSIGTNASSSAGGGGRSIARGTSSNISVQAAVVSDGAISACCGGAAVLAEPSSKPAGFHRGRLSAWADGNLNDAILADHPDLHRHGAAPSANVCCGGFGTIGALQEPIAAASHAAASTTAGPSRRCRGHRRRRSRWRHQFLHLPRRHRSRPSPAHAKAQGHGPRRGRPGRAPRGPRSRGRRPPSASPGAAGLDTRPPLPKAAAITICG
mmetsp:Transcript_127394/g.407744  ORF Transcript_127394/g.407744 Transcript_127394/m.407744 type:complete len:303 (-) Transcript_127394:609-1517(-)